MFLGEDDGGWRASASDFQRQAVAQIVAVLEGANVELSRFEMQPDGWLCGTFLFNGRQYSVEVYRDTLVMTSGRRYLFELIWPEELESEEAQIVAFCRRLRRLLETGDWFTERDLMPWDRWWRRLRTWIRRE